MRTGFEEVLSHRTSDNYAYSAKEDGIIVDVDNKLNLVKVKYKSGETVTFEFGHKQASVDGIYIDQPIVLNFKKGDKFKRGDILAYNSGFFIPKHGSKQVLWKHGVHANTAFLESGDTIEDSSAISSKLSKKLKMFPTHVRTIKVTNKTVLHDIVKVGDELESSDPLCVIEDEDISELSLVNEDDTEATELITDLNKKTPKAKHDGIVSKIDVLYSCEIDDMTPSLAKFVRNEVNKKNRKHNYSKDSSNTDDFLKSTKVAVGTKYKNLEFDNDTIMIIIYITEDIGMSAGDKLVLDSSLKSVVGRVMYEEVRSDQGVDIDVLFGGISLSNRIINSPVRQGLAERILEKLEQDVLAIWDE